MLVTVVIRTLNEARYLDELLEAVAAQKLADLDVEIVIVDSGSSDATIAIAQRHGAVITHIRAEDFSFGRSLNHGCEIANGDFLVFISGHCVPASNHWLERLLAPLRNDTVGYCYGRQLGRDTTRFSERRVFEKYYPDQSLLPQEGFFCNNANAAIRRDLWKKYRFDEELTGLEDMHLAQRIAADGDHIGYAADAAVYHIHDESWAKIKRRYEREAIALQEIMPQVHVSIFDFFSCVATSVASDSKLALKERAALSTYYEILLFRICQFWGSYSGNHIHRELSREMKRRYYYPNENVTQAKSKSTDESADGAAAD